MPCQAQCKMSSSSPEAREGSGVITKGKLPSFHCFQTLCSPTRTGERSSTTTGMTHVGWYGQVGIALSQSGANHAPMPRFRKTQRFASAPNSPDACLFSKILIARADTAKYIPTLSASFFDPTSADLSCTCVSYLGKVCTRYRCPHFRIP